jgi:hypothetical protein
MPKFDTEIHYVSNKGKIGYTYTTVNAPDGHNEADVVRRVLFNRKDKLGEKIKFLRIREKPC